MTDRWVPDEGELVWLSLERHRGREQGGRRPFFVLTPRAYNAITSLMVGVPVTSAVKGYPFEVPLPAGGRVSGVILADQVKSVDWRVRFAEHADATPEATLREVRTLLAPLLGMR